MAPFILFKTQAMPDRFFAQVRDQHEDAPQSDTDAGRSEGKTSEGKTIYKPTFEMAMKQWLSDKTEAELRMIMKELELRERRPASACEHRPRT